MKVTKSVPNDPDQDLSAQTLSAQTLYDTDYLQWIITTVAQLQHQAYDTVDWAHLIEELEDMGKRERRSLESNLTILILHLLKWEYQPQQRSGSWLGSIIEHRRRLRKALRDSPSLQPYLVEVLGAAYQDAVQQAVAETGLTRPTFPKDCPYAPEKVMNEKFPSTQSGQAFT
jgi:hypothetical protein